MDEQTLKDVASQLRKPDGEAGIRMGEKMNESNLHINRNTIAALDLKEEDRILEIGMGNGNFVHEIVNAAENIHYTGCDFSQTMVEESRINNADFVKNKQASFLLGDAEALPFRDWSFNKVFTINTIYFWNDAPKVLSEIRRVLRPGGILVIAIRPKYLMQDYPFTKFGFNLFEIAEVSDLLAANSFEVTKAFEKEEPPQNIAGHEIKVASGIIIAKKIQEKQEPSMVTEEATDK